MRKTLTVTGAFVILALAASGVLAQQQATVLLRSGERVSGGFEDIQNNLIYIRVSHDDEQRIPVERAALVDFVGGTRGIPLTEVSEARGGDHLLLFRDGTSMKGRLLDVTREGEGEHTVPGSKIEVIFKGTDGVEQRLDVTRIARLYLGNFPAGLDEIVGAKAAPTPAEPGPEPTTPPPADGRLVTVPANVAWVDTGIRVREGDMVAFTATGEIVLSGDATDTAAPAGSRRERYEPGAPLPQSMAGALVGRVGTSAVFGIGNQTVPLRMPATGALFLGVNDGMVSDNSGQFKVTIRQMLR